MNKLTIIEWGWAAGYEELCRSGRFHRCGELSVNGDWCRSKANSWYSTYLVKNMLVWIKKSQKKCWFKQRRSLRQKIKYQTSCCYQRPLSAPAQYTRENSDSAGRKKYQWKNCNCNGRKSPLLVKQTRNKAEQNEPIIEKCVVSSCVVIGLLHSSTKIIYTYQNGLIGSRFWTVLVNCAASRFGILNIWNYSPQFVLGVNICNTYSHIYLPAGRPG